ncbi:uncharacterized protein LOC142979537 isoform X2 [Anticarsia gemmatalis]|uniref:uncharacterized protein LOC142979537 isoform X2 n=1 Tax=Anticarsia gemmatalis TaxID=129554 RepID=UPI003F763F37
MAVFDVFQPLAHVTPRFTEEQLEEIVQWFDENAKPLLVINEGEPINVVTIEQYHRRSFRYPTYQELMLEVEKIKAGVTRVLTKDQLIYILDRWILMPEIKHELGLAFQIFDTENRNFLEIDEISLIVTQYGEPFSEDETREILRDANVRGDGIVYYENFIESLFSIAPELYELKTEYLFDDPDEDPSVPPEPVIEEVEEEPPPPPPPPPPPAKGKKKK